MVSTTSSDSATLVATIVANSGTGRDCVGEGTYTSDYNLDDDGSCAFSGTSLSDTPAGLDTAGLQANGGPTQTIALEPGSAAIDHVALAADCTGKDQRGVPWPTPCDIGAIGAPSLSSIVLIPTNGATLSGTTTLDASASNATSVEFWLFGGSYGYGQLIGTATLSAYGWAYSWNTTTVPNASYTLLSEAFNASASAFSAGVSIKVSNSAPPTTTVLVPANGATVSGTTTLDASASNATSVEFWLFGGSYGLSGHLIGTATLSAYGWAYSWNTTTVPNASYTLLSEAFNASASAFSAGVSIKVSNSAAPTTTVLVPANGATVSGTTTLDASASNATSVEFWLFGGSYGLSGHLIGTATLSAYGWVYSWNTTTVPNASYTLLSEAFNASASAFSAGVSITVKN